ncbi:MAG: hypothetical protein ACI9SE_001431 [Neolewinella sp.]|jgi:hypothetical protein
MSNRYSKRYRASSWLLGFGVLVAVGIAVTWMLYEGSRKSLEVSVGMDQEIDQEVNTIKPGGLPELMSDVRIAQPSEGVFVRGKVLLPAGLPAASATVTLYRLVTAAPEWRKEHVVQAITGDDGAFQFRCPHLYGYLLGFQHPDYAGGEVEVSTLGNAMQLQLRPGFDISGTVLNDVGAPVPKARVSVESVLGDARRAQFTFTAADGTYSFTNLAAGAAEMVAWHGFWQPAKATAVVIGVRHRTDFRFARPSMSPLRGRVVRAATQEPIEGATVELERISSKLGLVDPVGTVTAKDGTFLLSGLARGSVRMLVRHADYGTSLQIVSIRSVAKDVAVELPDRATVAGEVQGVFAGGEILEAQDSGRELAYATVQPDGTFLFGRKLSPGFVDFRVLGGSFLFQNLRGTSARMLLDEPEDGKTAKIYLDAIKTSVVQGRLADADGNPVGGARIEWMSGSLGQLGAAAWQLDIAKASDGFFKLIGAQHQLLAISDEQGRFEIRGRRSGLLQAKVSCAGCGNRVIRTRVPPAGRSVDIGEIVLEPSCSVSGRVLRGGQPFVGALVILSSPQSESLATTNQLGEYSVSDLMPGKYFVQTRISGRPTGSTNRIQITVAPDKPVTGFDLSLKAGRIITGIVTDENSEPLRGALISVRGRTGEVVTTNAAGVFELELLPRNFELLVSFGYRSIQKIVPISMDQKRVSVTLASRDTSTLVARIAGLPGRRPLAGVLLRLTELDLAGAEANSRWVETSGGELRHSHVPSGRVLVEVWSEGYAPYQREWRLKPGEDHDLGELLLARGAKLRGVVRDAAGSAVHDAMVLLGDETDFSLFLPTVRTDVDGMFTIQGITSRSKQLVVRSPGFAANTIGLQLPGDVLSIDPLEIQMERGTTIEVSVARRLIPEDGLVYLRRENHLLESSVLDDIGKAWFANRSAGKYTVQLLGSDQPEQVVEVKAGQELSYVRFFERSK